MANHIARAGATAFLLGMTFTGPQIAVAAADSPNTDSPAASAGPAGRDGKETGSVAPRSVRSGARGSQAQAAATVHGARAAVTAVRSPASAAARPASRLSAPPEAAAQPVAAAAADPVGTQSAAQVQPRSAHFAPRAATAPSASAASSTGNAGCAVCWGATAASPAQVITAAVNHLFNSAFTGLSAFPANPISDIVAGALVLIRRTLFFVPEGVTASLVGNSLTVAVNTGSVAYFRQDGSSLQISGDPSFFRATTFTTGSQTTVSVGNPGNAGCAGVVLASGQMAGALTTSQIDSVRFGAGASVAGKVTLAVTNGDSLTLRDAVRGMQGVEIDAPVILANNVSVEAGNQDVKFAGTVDAAKAGKQSLSVTALGKTTFEAAVGGVTPLASLLTQGIAPLVIQQSADSVTIPLHYLPEFSTSGQGQVKYGIDVAIGHNPSQMYEFDTGGVAFFAGYNSAFWKDTPLTSTGVSETYSSTNYYNGVVANTAITLGQGSHTVSTQPIQIAAILNGGNTNAGTTFDFTNPDAPPVQDHFFGDFGASFNTLAVPGLANPLANPLFQLPGNLSSGFLVQLGPIGIQPQLTVGVTDSLRNQFTYAVPVTPASSGGTYPVSGYQVLSWFGFAPSYTAQQGDQPAQQIGVDSTLPSLIDSGAPSTGIRTQNQGGDPYNVNDQLQPGTTFTAQFPTTMGRDPLTWTFVAGDNGSVNLVHYQAGQPGGIQNVNTGLNLYNDFDVMFDVADQVIWLRPTGAQATVSLQSVTTTGSQTYRQAANLTGTYTTGGGDFTVGGVTTLLGSTVVNAGSGDVTFAGTVDAGAGAAGLAVNSGGSTQFVREVGSLQPLTSLTTDAGGTTSAVSVATTGNQTYNDAVSLNGLYSTTGGSFTAGGAATLVGPVSVAGGDITFGGRIDSQSGRGYQLTLTPGDGKTAQLNGDVGVTNPLGGLTLATSGSNASATVIAPHYVALAGNLGFSNTKGLSIGDGVTATFTGGGLIANFTDSGVVIAQSNGSTIQDFAISGNGGNGVQLNETTGALIENNVIIDNGSDGVVVSTGSGNQILSNSIYGNGGTGGLGIHLQTGGNNDQPAPDVQSAVLSGTSLTVTFTVQPPSSGLYTVQVFYSPSTAGSPVQGQQLLDTVTNVQGHKDVTITVPGTVSAGGFITVTATSASGDTSEFSTAATITT
ncbi:right-handed parallel beta-helix repeat-containing protein [Mycolicibacterium sp. CH28]|uniref:beta strand repeat-containing protein n=1 Tax=Mycolicibacterium sp. CH28 TaxID=2512237 RepID=UPI00108058E1|nr:right-handed parallel beta-helix repeat-containing protein [Mycolicibacterium sp. CH28]TGD84587.1 right-handed parallel beta-helix repeat-containing protein [Mycolicibacterium sp. CH28]